MTDEDRGRLRPNRNSNRMSDRNTNEVLSIAEEILRERTGLAIPQEPRPVLDFATLQSMPQ